MPEMSSLLSLAIWIPIFGAFVVFACGEQKKLARWTALAVAFAGFAITLPLYIGFDPAQAGMQFVEQRPWIPLLNIEYLLGVDGISVLFILLNSFVTILVVIAGWEVIEDKVAQYMGAFLIMSGLMNGIFCALDAVLFYVFFEASLIPMYIIIGVWGGPNRVYAAFKFFLYTLLGSLLMLIALIWLYLSSGGSFNLLEWHQLRIDMTPQILLFLAFLVAFAVKVPMWPVHTWLPDAHVEAPTAGSVLLAALLLKMGGYGLFRIVMPMLPNVSNHYITLMAVIGVISIIYGGFLALAQKDLKKMVAYSSVSHMGYVLLGAGALSVLSVQGAMFQQFSHGLITCVLFMSAGTIQHTAGTRIISELGGLSDRMPKFAVLMLAGFMASLGLPGMCGFVAELSVLAGAYQNLPVYVLIVIFGGIAVTAGYHLWAMQKVMFGPILKKYLDLKDPHSYEILSMSILILLIIYFGVQPATITDIMGVAAQPLVDPFTAIAQAGVI